MSKRRLTRERVQASTEDDPLTAELDEYLAGEGDDESAAAGDDPLTRHGLSVRQLAGSNDTTTRQRWVVVWHRANRQWFAGKTMAWSTSPNANIPFDTRDDAESAAQSHAESIDRFASPPVYMVKHLELRVPVATDARSQNRPMKVGVAMDMDETLVMEQLQCALRQVNADFAPGKPVISFADVVRWLLAQIKLQVEDHES